MLLRSLFGRLPGQAVSEQPATEATPGEYRACDEASLIARPFSPLVGEMVALYCHARTIGALSQDEDCCDEYRMTARAIIHHILVGWENQTAGRGTIDDLLLQPRTSHLSCAGESAPCTQSCVTHYC
ncbi:hypothetical protein ABT282_34065 [Streptomyces sp. NPDC000927]|uniref:hypothetical protein n=1 Tax=Streptomyces sp. NPDC000927 TaxID=3154371 RepID=UPI0033184B89